MFAVVFLIVTFSFLSANAHQDPRYDDDWVSKFATDLHDLCVDVTGATDDQIKQIQNGNFIQDEGIKIQSGFELNRSFLEVLIPNSMKNKKTYELFERCFELGKNSGHTELFDKIYDMIKCQYEADAEEFIMY